MITKVAVLGSGTMGAQIAAHISNAGLPVLLLDLTTDQTDRAVRSLAKISPAPFFTPEKAKQIQTGSFDNDMPRIRDADWIIEAVVENAAIKHPLLDAVDKVRRPGSLVTTNTSGLSVTALAKDRSPDFRRIWFGTHFFNPPRYMRLLEIIPTAETDPKALAEFERFAAVVLGKGIVRAKDTPNFIANRIGLFAALRTIQLMRRTRLHDRRSRSAYRSVDWPGQDSDFPHHRYGRPRRVRACCREHLRERTCRSQREIFRVPEFMRAMLDKKLLGAKTGRGFYKKDGDEILTLDLETMEYRKQQRANLPALEMSPASRVFPND